VTERIFSLVHVVFAIFLICDEIFFAPEIGF
jgi:hypothetical protein